MWVVQGATQRFIKNKSQGVRDKTLGLIVHVQAGNGELTGWYNNPESQASSCWQVMKTGTVFQFGDPDVDKFWTQAAGNPDYGAAEGEGKPSEPMTDAQLDGFARIYAAGHINEGWPFQLAEKPGDRGLGWHGMGGAAWGGHYNCPGDIRKAQRPEILRRAQALITQEDDVTPQELLDVLHNYRRDKSKGLAGMADSGDLNYIVQRQSNLANAIKALAATIPGATSKAVIDALGSDFDASITLTPKP